MKQKKIFFVAYGAGHIAMLIPVIKHLQESASADILVLGLTTAQEKLQRAGIPYVGYADLAKKLSHYSQIKEIGERLSAELPPGPVPVEESIAYMGVNYSELHDTFGQEGAAARYKAQGRQAFLPLNFMKHVLNEYRPDLVVATNSPRTERAAILAAGTLGIPAICLVDLFALQEVAWIGEPGYADKICVLSQMVKDMLIAHGRKESEVVVTGNPAFDALAASISEESRKSIRRAHGWSDDEQVILYASQVEPAKHPFADLQGNPALPRQIDEALFQIIAKHSQRRLILRHHPSESVKYDALPDRVEIGERSENLTSLLHSVDAVVVTASTVGLEAALIGKPVVSVDTSVFTPDAPYSRMGISIGVDNLDHLEDALEKALSGGAPADAARTDGKATERIVDQILSMLNVYS